MRKTYIQPEAELLSLALLEDFLTGSSDEITDEDVTVNGGTTGGGSEGEGSGTGTGAGAWENNDDTHLGTGGSESDGNDFEDDWE